MQCFSNNLSSLFVCIGISFTELKGAKHRLPSFASALKSGDQGHYNCAVFPWPESCVPSIVGDSVVEFSTEA